MARPFVLAKSFALPTAYTGAMRPINVDPLACKAVCKACMQEAVDCTETTFTGYRVCACTLWRENRDSSELRYSTSSSASALRPTVFVQDTIGLQAVKFFPNTDRLVHNADLQT